MWSARVSSSAQRSLGRRGHPARLTGNQSRTAQRYRSAATSRERLEEILEPGLDPLGQAVHARTRERPVPAAGRREARGRAMRAVESETNHGGEARGIHGVAQPADVLRRRADPDSGAEHIRGELGDTLHRRRAASDDDTTVEALRKTCALDLAKDEIENLVHALVDDVREYLARDVPIALRDGARELDDVLRVDQWLVRAAVFLLQPLGVGLRDADALHDIAGDVVATVIYCAQVTNLSFMEDRDVGRAGAHLHQCDAELRFVFGEHAEGAGS